MWFWRYSPTFMLLIVLISKKSWANLKRSHCLFMFRSLWWTSEAGPSSQISKPRLIHSRHNHATRLIHATSHEAASLIYKSWWSEMILTTLYFPPEYHDAPNMSLLWKRCKISGDFFYWRGGIGRWKKAYPLTLSRPPVQKRRNCSISHHDVHMSTVYCRLGSKCACSFRFPLRYSSCVLPAFSLFYGRWRESEHRISTPFGCW